MVKKNDDIQLNIESITSEGNGVGHYEGLAVFVPETAVGDVILCRIVKVKKSYAYGIVKQILTASADRIENACEVSHRCGGCSYRHMSYESELRVKEQVVKDALVRIGKIDCEFSPIISTGVTDRYRNKAQYPVREVNGEIQIGFFAKRSHTVIESSDCMLEPEQFSRILEAVKFFCTQYKIKPYNEVTHTGVLRHIYLRRSSSTGEIHLCLVINGRRFLNEQGFVRFITSACKDISGISLNFNSERTNVILGKDSRVIYGKGYITDTILEKTFHISPNAFFQVNRDATQLLYSEVKRLLNLKKGETLIDLYCGIGTIGLSVSDDTNNLIGVEVVPQAVEDAKKNAELNGRTNAKFYCSAASDMSDKFRERGERADAVILDPPRKGIDENTARNVVAFSPARIVYVSCNPATLARDLAVFETLGYKTISATPVDMFPRTTHVETVCLLHKIEN